MLYSLLTLTKTPLSNHFNSLSVLYYQSQTLFQLKLYLTEFIIFIPKKRKNKFRKFSFFFF